MAPRRDAFDPKAWLQQTAGELRESFARNRRVISFGEYFKLFAATPAGTCARRPSTCVTSSITSARTRCAAARPITRWRLFDAPGTAARTRCGPGRGPVRGLSPGLQLRARGADQPPHPAARTERLGEVDVRGHHSSARWSTTRRSRTAPSTASTGSSRHRSSTKGGIGFGGVGGALRRGRRRRRDVRVPRGRPHRGQDRRRDARPPAAPHPAPASAASSSSSGSPPPSPGGFRPADYLLRGDLSHRNRQIFEALLASYHGDLAKVLRHVQVERFFVSRRYRQAASTVEPQLAVDAHVKPADHGPLARVAAARAAVADAVRVPGRARRRQPRRDRLRRSAQTSARVVQVPLGHGRAGARLAGRREHRSRHDLHRLVERGLPLGLQGDPRVPILQGAHGARARALPARLPHRAAHLRGPDPGGARRIGQARRAARGVGHGAVGGADAHEEAARREVRQDAHGDRGAPRAPREGAAVRRERDARGAVDGSAPRARRGHREDRARVRQLPELRGPHGRVAARDEAAHHERGAEPEVRVPVAVRDLRRDRRARSRRHRVRLPQAGAAAGRLPREQEVHLPGARQAHRSHRRRGAHVDGPRRGAPLHRSVRALRHARLVLGQAQRRCRTPSRVATRIPTKK